MTTQPAVALPWSRQLRSARERAHPEGLASALAEATGEAADALRERLAGRLGLDLDGATGEESLSPLSGLVPVADCRRFCAVPVAWKGGVAVAIDDPWAIDAVQRIAEHLGGAPALLWSTRPRVLALIEGMVQRGTGRSMEGGTSRDAASPIGDADLDGPSGSTVRVISLDTAERASSPVVRFVDLQIMAAWGSGASDIHWECDRQGIDVRFRLDGVLVSAARLDGRPQAEQVVNRIKVLAQLDIAETRIPQDGRFRAKLGGRAMDFRVSVMPSAFGEDAVIRLLDKAQLRSGDDRIDLRRLGFQADSLDRIRAMAIQPHGMLLVTGPTGSGKTTTLYALLSELHRGDEKIITIEDPVEYELPGVLQIPVNEKKGLTFARGLRSILRHDPDRILVGEIRDSETAEIAVQAALTGHLVLTTVHANNVYDVVGRFLHMGVDLYGLVAALNGIVAQRLLRKVCERCAIPLDDVGVLRAVAVSDEGCTELRLRRGLGCEHCRGTGYSGRTVVSEVITVDHPFRELIAGRASGRQLREHVATLDVTPLREAALRLVRSGITTLEEVDRVVGRTD